MPDNIKPEDSIYYNGAIVLQLLIDKGNQRLVDLYAEVKSRKDMSFSIFMLCMDWLFLINVAENIDGEVRLCS